MGGRRHLDKARRQARAGAAFWTWREMEPEARFAPAGAVEEIIRAKGRARIKRGLAGDKRSTINALHGGERRLLAEIDRDIRRCLAAGHVGVAATLTVPSTRVWPTLCPPAAAARLIREVLARLRRALARAGVSPLYTLTIMEPHPDGLPHAHILVLVPPDQADLAYDRLDASVWPRGNQGERRAGGRLLKRSKDLTERGVQEEDAAARGRGVRKPLNSWLRYHGKTRIRRVVEEGRHPDLPTLKAWGRTFGLGRTLSRTSRPHLEARLAQLAAGATGGDPPPRQAPARPKAPPTRPAPRPEDAGSAGQGQGAARQARHRARKSEAGERRVELWARPEHLDVLRAVAAMLARPRRGARGGDGNAGEETEDGLVARLSLALAGAEAKLSEARAKIKDVRKALRNAMKREERLRRGGGAAKQGRAASGEGGTTRAPAPASRRQRRRGDASVTGDAGDLEPPLLG